MKTDSPVPAFLKKNHLCPICAAKRLAAAFRVNIAGADRFDNGAALTPPMGWASWNLFRHNVNEEIIKSTAEALKKTGLADLGYRYVNIDDCWMASVRDTDGKLRADEATFPSGIKKLVEDVNSFGLSVGLYTSNGTFTCEGLPSSLYHERKDAETFADWGIEYFKYDFCHNEAIPTNAPEIEKLTVRLTDGSDAVYYAHEAQLRGAAEVFEDSALTDSGKYVGGLSSNAGAIIFDNISVPVSGIYTVTVGFRKTGKYEKFADLTFNGTDRYSMRLPSATGGREGRYQLDVKLNKGANTLMINNPIASRADSAARQYRDMGKELMRAAENKAARTGEPVKPICYSICEWGLNRPWKWGYTAGNLWRTTPDIRPEWLSIVGIYEVNVRLYAHAGKGNWNDPDMLEVGNGELNDDENRAHFSLWCMMAAPLILGCDIRKFIKDDGTVDRNNSVYKIISNAEAIAIDQDPLGVQCRRIKTNGRTDVLVKPLENGEVAVCLFNKTGKRAEAGFSIKELTKESYIDLPDAEGYEVRNIWQKTDFISTDRITEAVEPHSVILYRIKAAKK